MSGEQLGALGHTFVESDLPPIELAFNRHQAALETNVITQAMFRLVMHFSVVDKLWIARYCASE